MLRGFRSALAVLTRLPAGRLQSGDFAAAPGWFAAVGILIGACQAIVFSIASPIWGAWIAAFLAIGTGVVLSGGLHEDGLADTADALGQPRPVERALEIMKDSRIGSYGALALVFGLGLKVAALAGLGDLAPLALLAGAVLSRLAMALALLAGPYLRKEGAASGMTGGWSPSSSAAALLASGFTLALLVYGTGLAVMLGGLFGLILLAAAIRAFAMRRLGGITGDILGAIQSLAEIGFFLGMRIWL